MKIFKNGIEFTKAALGTLAVVLAIFAAYSYVQEQHHATVNHTQTLEQIAAITAQIKANQFNNSTALETFIRTGLVCIAVHPLPIPATNAQIQTEANMCFPNTKAVK